MKTLIRRLAAELIIWLRSPRPISYIRTWVPKAVGGALVYLATRWGFVLSEEDSATVTIGATVFAGGAYYWIVRRLEERIPKAGRLLGRAMRPVYKFPDDRQGIMNGSRC